jgi:hypothetical protein
VLFSLKALKLYYGIIMENSTLVDGKESKMDLEKKLVMESKLFLINIYIKANL